MNSVASDIIGISASHILYAASEIKKAIDRTTEITHGDRKEVKDIVIKNLISILEAA